MKEIRGAEAIRYARENGIYFDLDQSFLTDAESDLTGERTSMIDIDRLLENKLGRHFDPAEIVPGGETFDFLINRYGDGWIYVAIEGNNPESEEKVALRMFRWLLEEQEPGSGSDVKDLLGRYGRPRLGETGFPGGTILNLLYHAALRLVQKGLLESVEDADPLPKGQLACYGRRRFFVPADVEVSLEGVLCERCQREHLISSLNLHRECAKRLRKVLAEATARS